jgi:hypothetical protein
MIRIGGSAENIGGVPAPDMNKPQGGTAMRRASIACIISLVAFATWAPKAGAYSQYSVNRDSTNCRQCHLDFQAIYTSLSDGQNWGDDLMDLHSSALSGDCDTCHSSGGHFPVSLNSSKGGQGLATISCVGCHGRDEDITANDGAFGGPGPGRGDGLRGHHAAGGVAVCAGCHTADAVPVGEDVDPPYYFTPDNNHPNKPTDPCNSNGGEDFAGLAQGTDNDGDNAYDGADSDCQQPPPGSCAGSANASVYGANQVYSTSALFEHLVYFVLPVGAVLLMRLYRRRKR